MASVFSPSGRYRILHIIWFAFFLTFAVWFNFAPFSTEFGLEPLQIRVWAIASSPKSWGVVALMSASLIAFSLKALKGRHGEATAIKPGRAFTQAKVLQN